MLSAEGGARRQHVAEEETLILEKIKNLRIFLVRDEERNKKNIATINSLINNLERLIYLLGILNKFRINLRKQLREHFMASKNISCSCRCNGVYRLFCFKNENNEINKSFVETSEFDSLLNDWLQSISPRKLFEVVDGFIDEYQYISLGFLRGSKKNDCDSYIHSEKVLSSVDRDILNFDLSYKSEYEEKKSEYDGSIKSIDREFDRINDILENIEFDKLAYNSYLDGEIFRYDDCLINSFSILFSNKLWKKEYRWIGVFSCCTPSSFFNFFTLPPLGIRLIQRVINNDCISNQEKINKVVFLARGFLEKKYDDNRRTDRTASVYKMLAGMNLIDRKDNKKYLVNVKQANNDILEWERDNSFGHQQKINDRGLVGLEL